MCWRCFLFSKIDMCEDKVVPCFEVGSEWLGLGVSFQQLRYWKVKVRYAFQFQESTRILRRMQNGLSRSTRALFLLHFLFWLALLVALDISTNIRILSKSKATFRLKCMHHGHGGRCTHGKGFLVIMISFEIVFFYWTVMVLSESFINAVCIKLLLCVMSVRSNK